jgi:hypothetical protein
MFVADAIQYHADIAAFITIVTLMGWLAHRFVPPRHQGHSSTRK